jgi:UDP:flavonoid glycosyltransferase YjiC (YdhE family)
MKFLLAFSGTRGDAEIGVAVGKELSRRGHDVRMAVSPDLVDFAESAGMTAVAYGQRAQVIQARDFGLHVYQNFPHALWKAKDLTRAWREYREFVSRYWVDSTSTLTSLADGCDVLVTGLLFEDGAANVAEYHGVPLATFHYSPVRPNGRMIFSLPAPLGRAALTALEWSARVVFGKFENEQRRELGLPKASGPATRRITDRGALEIQAYEEVCFPGLAAEWAKRSRQRPFVGTITLELATDADDDVESWIAAGPKPICFAFGSMSVESATTMIAMISSSCAQLGERALICSGTTDFSDVPHHDHVKVVGLVNYATVFPACRAVVHHGGSGTVAAVLRAGVPQVILWSAPDRQMWGAVVKRLGVGTARRFSGTTRESLVTDLRAALEPARIARAQDVSTRTRKPVESVAAAADRLEEFALLTRGRT